MSWALRQTTGAPATKVVLLVLANVADEHGVSWHSQRSLSLKSEVPVRSLRRHLETLEERGFLRRTGRMREDGGKASDYYQLMLDPPATLAGPPGQALAGPPPATLAGTSGQALAGEEKQSVEPIREEPSVEEQTDSAPAALAVVWMHEAWLRQFGSSQGPKAKLTPLRRQKYRAMFEEHLARAPDPQLAWQLVLRTLAASDHHASKMEYLMPESFLRSPERRDRWVLQTAQNIERADRRHQGADEFAAVYRAMKEAHGR
jgi:hypothetical protein